MIAVHSSCGDSKPLLFSSLQSSYQDQSHFSGSDYVVVCLGLRFYILCNVV